MKISRQDIEILLSKLPHELNVRFVLHCCNDIKNLITDQKSLNALLLVEKWLHNPKSVTSKELVVAYTNASAAANSAASAAYAASAASASASSNYEKKLKQYYNDLKIMVKELTPLQLAFIDLELT